MFFRGFLIISFLEARRNLHLTYNRDLTEKKALLVFIISLTVIIYYLSIKFWESDMKSYRALYEFVTTLQKDHQYSMGPKSLITKDSSEYKTSQIFNPCFVCDTFRIYKIKSWSAVTKNKKKRYPIYSDGYLTWYLAGYRIPSTNAGYQE